MYTFGELLKILKSDAPQLPPGSPEGVVPSYMLPGYLRASAADEIAAAFLHDPQSIGALLHSALFDPERLVRDRAIHGLFKSKCNGLESMLIACTFDTDEEIRLLAFEAILDQGFLSATDVAIRLRIDPDEDVAKLAETFLSGKQWLVYRLQSP